MVLQDVLCSCPCGRLDVLDQVLSRFAQRLGMPHREVAYDCITHRGGGGQEHDIGLRPCPLLLCPAPSWLVFVTILGQWPLNVDGVCYGHVSMRLTI